MPQVSAADLRSTPSSTSASASIRRAAARYSSPRPPPCAAPKPSIKPGDATPQKTASSQNFTDLGIPNESQLRAVGIRRRWQFSKAGSQNNREQHEEFLRQVGEGSTAHGFRHCRFGWTFRGHAWCMPVGMLTPSLNGCPRFSLRFQPAALKIQSLRRPESLP